MELFYDRNDTANEEDARPFTEFNGSPDLQPDKKFNGAVHQGPLLEVHQSGEFEQQNSEQMGPMAGTGMNLCAPAKPTEPSYADVGGLGYRTNYGQPLAPKKADRNVESVNDIGLITGSQQELATQNQVETRKIHAGREAEIKQK